MVTEEAKYSQQRIDGLFRDADRTLLEVRARYSADHAKPGLEHWNPVRGSGGIAMIAPDGQIIAATPEASTAGWPRLMARLADSPDVLAIGDSTRTRTAVLVSFRWLAGSSRRMDRSAAWSAYSLATRELSGLASPSITGNEWMCYAGDRRQCDPRPTPEVRGTVGIRMAATDAAAMRKHTRRGSAGVSAKSTVLTGFSRYRRFPDMPVTLIVGVGHDAIFSDWKMLRFTVTAGRLLATAFILVIAVFWYGRRNRAKISGDALTAILSGIEPGIRVETRDGAVVAANEAGAALRMPDTTSGRAEIQRPDGSIIQLVRHDIADGGTVLIGN